MVAANANKFLVYVLACRSQEASGFNVLCESDLCCDVKVVEHAKERPKVK